MTIFAFWPGYFSRLGSAKIAWHIHAVTATAWVLLLAAQSWSIDRGQRALHRGLGLAIFLLVPLFLIGGAGVEHSMAIATASGQDPFYNLWGPSLGIYDLVASIAFVALTAMALKERRNVQRHAAWLLATPLLLVGPALGRIYNSHLPGLIIDGPQDFPLFRYSVHLGGLTAIAAALWLWSRHRRHGQPWLIVAGIAGLQSFLYETVGFLPLWKSAFIAFGTVPAAVHATGAGALAAAVLWWGWRSGAPRRAQPAGFSQL
ncbi:hypothetical protein BWQ93_14235 [Sphingopyxis sp. QXT-31]|uniref:hypothetical protein n=1 Tax=Sphingopyxis sp. QXT-31 TaxID=1357916 RepID=UPI0009791442|nr:hypothetical protein [Sphingopyxis sp. QXT-31]APZ99514.1 hypothetical protein BWQ93_14235 [Sphingopyxis sp. QXT-31]